MKQKCSVRRWDLIIAGLNNLSFEAFFKSASIDERCVLLDVRTASEVTMDPIPDARHIDYLSIDLADHLEKLDMKSSYYVFCRTSRRSSRVCVILKNLGFSAVYNLKGGLMEGRTI